MDYKPVVAVANTDDSSISLVDPIACKEARRIQLPAKSGPYDLVKLGSGLGFGEFNLCRCPGLYRFGSW